MPDKLFFTLILLFAISASGLTQDFKTRKVVERSDYKPFKKVYFVRNQDADVKEGVYKEFFRNKQLFSMNYSGNVPEGKCEFTGYNDTVRFVGNYRQGKKHGLWQYDILGHTASVLHYTNDALDSATGYWRNGNVACRERFDAEGTGVIRVFYKNGGLKEVIPVKNHKPDGVYRVYFSNGKLHREIMFVDSVATEVMSTFDLEGQPIDGGNLKNGKGSFIAYLMPEDTIARLSKFRYYTLSDGELNGKFIEYAEDGTVKAEGTIRENRAAGLWKFYQDGALHKEIDYDSEPYAGRKKWYAFEILSAVNGDKELQLPQFPGGERERLDYLSGSIEYPKEDRKHNISGVVYVRFKVNTIGEVHDPGILKGVSKTIDHESMRIIEEMPRWTPGFSMGIPVDQLLYMPLKFTIR